MLQVALALFISWAKIPVLVTTGVCKYAKIKPEKCGSFFISLHQNHEILMSDE